MMDEFEIRRKVRCHTGGLWKSVGCTFCLTEGIRRNKKEPSKSFGGLARMRVEGLIEAWLFCRGVALRRCGRPDRGRRGSAAPPKGELAARVELVPFPISLEAVRGSQNPNGLAFVESHFSQRTREMGHPLSVIHTNLQLTAG